MAVNETVPTDIKDIIDFIDHDGVYGPNMREAIARGIELMDSEIDDRDLFFTTEHYNHAEAKINDFLLKITNPNPTT